MCHVCYFGLLLRFYIAISHVLLYSTIDSFPDARDTWATKLAATRYVSATLFRFRYVYGVASPRHTRLGVWKGVGRLASPYRRKNHECKQKYW
jgi:hypothetical protein